MKKTWIALLGLIPGLAMAQEKPYTVQGTTKTVDTGNIMFVRYTLSTGQKKENTQIANHAYTFTGTVNNERQRGQLILATGRMSQSVLFYLEPGTITIEENINSCNNATIGGTPLNRDYNEYFTALSKLVMERKVNQFDKSIYNAKLGLIDAFITKHPKSPVGADLLNELAIGYAVPDSLEMTFKKLSTQLQGSETGIDLATRIKGMRSAKVGDMAPVFILPDTNGKTVSLKDFEGKYVLIDFWATWCIPCLAEMPYVSSAYDKYKSKNFEVVGISLDRPDSKALWLKTIQTKNMTWPQVSDLKWWNSTAALQYNITGVPANFLVDPKGKIIAMDLRGEALEKKLAEVLPK